METNSKNSLKTQVAAKKKWLNFYSTLSKIRKPISFETKHLWKTGTTTRTSQAKRKIKRISSLAFLPWTSAWMTDSTNKKHRRTSNFCRITTTMMSPLCSPMTHSPNWEEGPGIERKNQSPSICLLRKVTCKGCKLPTKSKRTRSSERQRKRQARCPTSSWMKIMKFMISIFE